MDETSETTTVTYEESVDWRMLAAAAGLVLIGLIGVALSKNAAANRPKSGDTLPVVDPSEPLAGQPWEVSFKHLANGWDERFMALDGRLDRIERNMAGAAPFVDPPPGV